MEIYDRVASCQKFSYAGLQTATFEKNKQHIYPFQVRTAGLVGHYTSVLYSFLVSLFFSFSLAAVLSMHAIRVSLVSKT